MVEQAIGLSSGGYLVANSPQDLFIIKGDFINQSTNSTDWKTDNAILEFAEGTDANHDFYIAGEDVGVTPEAGNFNWRLLDITDQTIYLQDGNLANTTAGGDGAQYVRILLGADVTSVPGQVSNIFNNTTYELNIYYDPKKSENKYLQGQTYDLAGTGPGQLIPDPSVSVAAQPLATTSTNPNSSFTSSTASAATGYFDAAAATNGYFYDLLYNFGGGSGNLTADDRSYSEPIPLAADPYVGWQTYDF